jgi:hypothetical protein
LLHLERSTKLLNMRLFVMYEQRGDRLGRQYRVSGDGWRGMLDYIYIYIYTRAHTHTHTRARTHTHIYIYMQQSDAEITKTRIRLNKITVSSTMIQAEWKHSNEGIFKQDKNETLETTAWWNISVQIFWGTDHLGDVSTYGRTVLKRDLRCASEETANMIQGWNFVNAVMTVVCS